MSEDIEYCHTFSDQYKCTRCMAIEIDKKIKEIERLKKQNEILKKACEFYGNRALHQDHCLNISIPGNKKKTSSIDDDQGRKARYALKECEGV